MRTCDDCGYLALRIVSDGRLIEADDNFRKMGVPAESFFIDQHRTFTLPVCFAREIEFIEALAEAGGKSIQNPNPGAVAKTLKVISRDDCASFVDWQQGLSPKEHREMLERLRLIEREDRRDQEMREREDRRDQEMREREDARDTEARKVHWRELLVFGGVIALATVAAAIIGVLFGGGDVTVNLR